jgi:uncharacterized membrane protein YdjX (TVP38/TMEM64 family)
MTAHERLRRHFLITGVLIIVAGFLVASDMLRDQADLLLVRTEALIAEAPFLGMLLFVLLTMLSAMLAFFSSALLAPVAIHAWGKAGCLALLWLGWLLGGIASFCIGRFLGRAVVVRLIGEEKVADWEHHLNRQASFGHVLLFQAALPSEIPGYVLGMLRYPFRLYVAALALTELPYALAVVYLGESFLEGKAVEFLLAGVAALVLGWFLLRMLKKKLKTGGS